MRSIGIPLRTATRAEAEAFLERLLPRPAKQATWVVTAPHKGDPQDPALYIEVSDANSEYWPFDPRWEYLKGETLDAAAKQFGAPPSCEVSADISGRHYHTRLTQWLAIQVLATFDGFAIDDYVDHLWTLDELRTGARVHGKIFDDTSSDRG